MSTPGLQQNEPNTTIRFGTYELDRQTGVLKKNGMRIRCQEQPLQVLAALAERPGELVTREELRRRVWPQDTFVDFDHALNTAIKKIRAALNDDAEAPRYIETIPRRGYRFVGAVDRARLASVNGFEAASQTAITIPATGARSSSDRKLWLLIPLATAAVLLAVLGLAWKRGWRHRDAMGNSEFQRLTFDTPELSGARFTPDGASVVYSAGHVPHEAEAYLYRVGAEGPQSISLGKYVVLSVSQEGEMAVLSESPNPHMALTGRNPSGVLARLPVGGGAPRELLSGVEAADWSPGGELAVVRHVGDKNRLEFPVGKVLYETIGWIASPRFSPRGDAIAFLDHPVAPDDRGSVALVDLNGKRRTLSEFWESERGLAWSPRGDEVWFAAARSGLNRQLHAVDLSGRTRQVLSVPGGLSLHDISKDGRVLLTRDNERMGIVFAGAAAEPRDLSWADWSMVTDLSPDGKQMLFGEEGENSGPSYHVGLRPTDGSAPVILGSGTAQSLSPDGKWALSIMPPPNEQIVLLPTGADTSKTLERGSVEHYRHGRANWFPDGKKIAFAAYQAGRGSQCFVQSVDAGKPQAITAEGMLQCLVSPDGTILAITEDNRGLIYASEASKKPEREFALQTGEFPSGWTVDGKYLYLTESGQRPMSILRMELATQKRQPWKPMNVPAEVGVKCEQAVVTPDGQNYAFTYSRHTADLYLVNGLR
jgi:DNA-binding winged helix-turn-helix (wHTH) protein/Tol biopolymer transport system component